MIKLDFLFGCFVYFNRGLLFHRIRNIAKKRNALKSFSKTTKSSVKLLNRKFAAL